MSEEDPGGAEGVKRRVIANNWGMPIDGLVFENAHIHSNVFYYSGGPLPRFVNCVIEDNQFDLQGPALNTLMFLHNMVRSTVPEERLDFLRSMGLYPPSEVEEGPDGIGD